MYLLQQWALCQHGINNLLLLITTLTAFSLSLSPDYSQHLSDKLQGMGLLFSCCDEQKRQAGPGPQETCNNNCVEYFQRHLRTRLFATEIGFSDLKNIIRIFGVLGSLKWQEFKFWALINQQIFVELFFLVNCLKQHIKRSALSPSLCLKLCSRQECSPLSLNSPILQLW